MTKPLIEKFETRGGTLIVRLPLEVFPGYFAYSHLIKSDGYLSLVDVGSGQGRSHEDLVDGLSRLQEEFGPDLAYDRIDEIIITHGHIDHFGGLAKAKLLAPQARIGLHSLAKPVLVNYDERLAVTSQRLEMFLKGGGTPPDMMRHLLEMHMLGKRAFKRMSVDFLLDDGQVHQELMRVIHVPGHEPGLIMLLIDDILLTSDHVLPETSVALAPETIMPYTGIGHYLESLDKAMGVEGVRVGLGGHEQAMPDYYDVVKRTKLQSLEKVARILALCDKPKTIYEIAREIYGDLNGYSALLKLEQTGARVEYLNQRGQLMIDNLVDLEAKVMPVYYVKI